MNKKNCIESTKGKIISSKNRGLDFPTEIIAEYEVDNKKYQITETAKLKSEVIKLWFIPIGQKKVPKVNITIGSDVKICYNPDNPQEAYIDGNDGIENC